MAQLESMRTKRLENIAHTLCHMFCGWRLSSSKPQLVILGDGTLDIDALTGNCLFEGKPTDALRIAIELREWLREDLERQGVPAQSLTHARVIANLHFALIPRSARTNLLQQFFKDGQFLQTEMMHQCRISCRSEVGTDQVTCRSQCEDCEEWPVGWP